MLVHTLATAASWKASYMCSILTFQLRSKLQMSLNVRFYLRGFHVSFSVLATEAKANQLIENTTSYSCRHISTPFSTSRQSKCTFLPQKFKKMLLEPQQLKLTE